MKHLTKKIWPLLLPLLLLTGCLAPAPLPAPPGISADAPAPLPEGRLSAAFFDVGQGDCILISTGGHAMLIDAGNPGQDELILGYLADYGVAKLDYLVATHPHADHIGSMAAVVYAMAEIGTVLMPEAVATTATFEKLLTALEERDLTVIVPRAGATYQLGEATVEVLAPGGEDYSELNDYSLVLRVSFGQAVFLFTGDAEEVSEAEQLHSGFDLRADVLKLGHHGSSSSSTAKYLAVVSPRYAVISCGRDNSYGHPHHEVLERLQESGIAPYRTDELGTVLFTTDGETITVSSVNAPPSLAAAAPPAQGEDYIGNKNSGIFHLPVCSSLPAEHNRVFFGNREEALDQGYRPCKSCQP